MSDEVELPDEVDESERGAWEAFIANMGDASGDEFREAYAGEWSSIEEYVDETIRELYDIPEWVEYYIDLESMGRDWELNGDIWIENASGGSFYVFRNL